MPNHLHLVMFVPEKFNKINSIISNGKRFLAYEIVRRLEINNNLIILDDLNKGVSIKERLRGKHHKVFEVSSDIKILATEKFIVQKINYIHQNPVRNGWELVEDYRRYKYSSAGFYDLDEGYQGYPVVNYSEAGERRLFLPVSSHLILHDFKKLLWERHWQY